MSRALARVVASATALAMIVVAAGTAHATHAWNGYHWSRPANPFTVTFSDNLTSLWDPFLTQGAADWGLTSGACNNPANPVRCAVEPGNGNPRNCRPQTGKVAVCNSTYGNTGWLGIAQIWVSGDHITKGSVKVNDTYHNSPPYNTPAWRQFVMSQEMGHTFGLGHQDEDFNNPDLLDACGRGSCMDYSSDPTNNTRPNQHDYDQLVIIYGSHLDGAALVADLDHGPPAEDAVDRDDPSAWGRAVAYANGRPVLYELDLGRGNKVLTRVIWAQ